MEKENNKTFFSPNTIFGLFIGLSYILTAFIFYKAGKGISLNPQLNNALSLLSIAGAFIGVRKYREEQLQGNISYGAALGACIYMLSIASVVYGIFIYYLYHHAPELQESYISNIETILQEVYKGSPLLENMKSMMETFMSSGVIAFAETFNKIFTGGILSLLLAGILRRNRKL